MVDVENGSSRQVASLPVDPEDGLVLAICGKARRSDGSEVVVVAGGHPLFEETVRDSYVYHVEGNFWRPGRSLPETRAWARAVQYGGSFLVVGGGESTAIAAVKRREILRYDADADEWEVLPQLLDDPDFVEVALIAPQGFQVQR